MFISIEGIEGTGKSTVSRFLRDYLLQHNVDVVLTREPGGTPVAEAIREVLLRHWPSEPIEDEVELMLMFASRMQHVSRLVKPTLAAGKWVISDRFMDASFAYQGGGRGLSLQRIQYLSDWVLQGFKPKLTFLLDADPALAAQRVNSRNQEKDRIEVEKIDFFNKTRETYLMLAAAEPERIKIINAELEFDQVVDQIKKILEPWVGS